MSYFKVFPRFAYPYNDAGERKTSVNIIKRFTFADYIKSNSDIYVRYQMKDSDTYQSLAVKLYGSADLHWILYLMNDISDPFTEIPKTTEELNLYINKKYPGHTILLDLVTFDGDFQVGEIITAGAYSATVVSWDASLRKIVVSGETGTNAVTGVITGQTTGSTGTFKRRVKNTVVVHHFEDEFGNILSPLPNPIIPDDDSPLDGYLDQAQQPDLRIITNTDYETNLNDEKRKIKILRVELKEQILADVGSVFK